MSDLISIVEEPLNYSFLLLTHMVCADQQLHTKELNYLQKLEQQTEVGQNTKEEKEKIHSERRTPDSYKSCSSTSATAATQLVNEANFGDSVY